MNILGIETSCDETSAAIIKDGILLSNIVYSQKIHIKYGGVVPEYASREHEKHLLNTINEAIKKVAEKGKYTYILDSSVGVLLYAKESENILEKSSDSIETVSFIAKPARKTSSKAKKDLG